MTQNRARAALSHPVLHPGRWPAIPPAPPADPIQAPLFDAPAVTQGEIDAWVAQVAGLIPGTWRAIRYADTHAWPVKSPALRRPAPSADTSPSRPPENGKGAL